MAEDTTAFPKTATIDLSAYGGEGFIEITKPSFKKEHDASNMMGRCAKNPRVVNGELVVDEINFGDLQVINLLKFVRKAPFKCTIQSFLDYMDMLDEKRLGAGAELFAEIQRRIAEVESPFADSPSAATGSSA